MLNLRIYRTAFIPFAFALVVVAFSLQGRPRPIATTLAPDAFSGKRAAATLDGLVREFPDRRPGSPGDMAVAARVRQDFSAGGFRVSVADDSARTIDGERTLRTVTATRDGIPGPQIVVVANRDAAGHGGAAELSGTAALIELAHVFAGRATRRTVTLVSTSGGSGGAAGAQRLARSLRGPVDGVIVLGDLASTRTSRPWVVPWSNTLGAAPARLQRTVELALRTEVGAPPGSTRAIGQFFRMALPLTVGEQGVLGVRGLPAVLVGPGGELGSPAAQPTSVARLDAFGRGVLRSVSALDNGPNIRPASPQSSIAFFKGRVLPAGAVRLFSGILLLPALLAAVDGLFRVRRRRDPAGRWVLWAACGALAFVSMWLAALLLRVTGLLPGAPAAPVAPDAAGASLAALAVVAAIGVIGWAVLRLGAVRRLGLPRPDTAGAAAGTAILTQIVVVAMWLRNPFAGLLLLPAAHLWLLAVAPEVRVGRVGAVALVFAGALPVLAGIVYYGFALNASPLDLARMFVLMLAGGFVGILSVCLWSLLLGCGCAALIVALRRKRSTRDLPVLRSRGPATYAGPGSLGGTDSALRR